MSVPATQNQSSTELAQKAPRNPVQIVGDQIRRFLENKTLHLPSDYSAENALKQAWLVLQTVQDKDKRPALEVCTQASIINALLAMVIQGLNVEKKQGYFIVYGKSLLFQRSYFGDQALVYRLTGAEVYSGLVYKNDTFKYEIQRGRTYILKHEQELENVNKADIIAAYAGLVSADGEDLGAVVMTMDRIKDGWAMSRTYKEGSGTHGQFTGEMALRSVIRNRCKGVINKSNDAILAEAIRASHEDRSEAELDAEIAENGNGELLSLAPVSDSVDLQLTTNDTVKEGELVEVPRSTDHEPQATAQEDPGY